MDQFFIALFMVARGYGISIWSRETSDSAVGL